MALLRTTTKSDFTNEVIDSDKIVLVDFWAAWCPPCRAMEPTLEKVANDLDATVNIVKINIEESAENQQLADEYGVQSIPNMVIFKNGKEVDRIIGMTHESALTDRLNKFSN